MAEIGKDENKITPQQQRAIAALLSTRNVAEAARTAKVGNRTLHRWLDDPTFRAHLASAEGNLIDAATRRLLQYQDAALTVVLTIMADQRHPASVRLRAATSVIDYMLQLRELRNVEQRLSALEQAYAQQQQ